VLREEFADWSLLFHPLTGEVVGIDPVGVTIWQLLDGQRTLAEVAAQVQARFEDAPDTVLEDTLAFVSDLQRRLFVLTEPAARHGDAETQRRGDTGILPFSASPRHPFIPSPRPPVTLSLADGTRLTLCAGDETAARVLDFLARAAALTPSPRASVGGAERGVKARRLLVVTDVGQIGNLPSDAVCVLASPDAPGRRRRKDLIRARLENRRPDPEPPPPEQWFWQQLARLSAAIAREAQPRGGVLLHSGLALTPTPLRPPSPLPRLGEGKPLAWASPPPPAVSPRPGAPWPTT